MASKVKSNKHISNERKANMKRLCTVFWHYHPPEHVQCTLVVTLQVSRTLQWEWSTILPKYVSSFCVLMSLLKFIFFVRCVSRYNWFQSNTAFWERNIMLTVKYDGGSVILFVCFTASGPDRLAVAHGTVNSAFTKTWRRICATSS